MRKKKKSNQNIIQNNLYILRLVWKISPGRVAWTFACALIDSGLWLFSSLVYMQFFFGNAERERTFAECCAFIAAATVLYLAGSLVTGWFEQRYVVITDQILAREMNLLLFEKACNVDIGCYENAEFFNSYTKASTDAVKNSAAVMKETAGLIACAVSVVVVMARLMLIHPAVGTASLLPAISILVFGRISSKFIFERRMKKIPAQRRQDYVNRTLYLQKFAKDIRLTNIFSVLSKTYDEAAKEKVEVAGRYWKRVAGSMLLRNIFCWPVMYEGIWILSAFLAIVKQSLTVADFVIISGAVSGITWGLIDLSENISSLVELSLYANNLKTFLNYKEKIRENQPGLPVPASPQILELRNVSFKYDGSDSFALKNIDMILRAGETVSLVGHNGSGKSTLVKLLMRLYDPSEGEIFLDGTDIREFNLRQYRRLIASTFQDFQLFSMSVFDNVVLGNETVSEPGESVANALEQSGAVDTVAALQKGSQTVLTREFDDEGTNLSGGEGQKIAIARAFAKKSAILILDEPSSALDPFAEYKMYQNFEELCKGKIAVFISHRLSTAAMASAIYMLQNGQVVERGNHGQLMKNEAAYAEMFKKQAQNYLREEGELQ